MIECVEEEEEKEEVPKDINLLEGDEFITGSLNFLEQTPSSAPEEEKGLCSEALDILWKVKDMVRRRHARELQQKKMTFSGSDEIINFSSVNNYDVILCRYFFICSALYKYSALL